MCSFAIEKIAIKTIYYINNMPFIVVLIEK